ncbi:MAG: hypothetical protein ABQ298_01010 [Puniceicoccaceae bacterium]
MIVAGFLHPAASLTSRKWGKRVELAVPGIRAFASVGIVLKNALTRPNTINTLHHE